MHYFAPPVQAMVSIAQRRTICGKLGALHLARQALPNPPTIELIVKSQEEHYEIPVLYAELRLTQLKAELQQYLCDAWAHITEHVTLIEPAEDDTRQMINEKVKAVPCRPRWRCWLNDILVRRSYSATAGCSSIFVKRRPRSAQQKTCGRVCEGRMWLVCVTWSNIVPSSGYCEGRTPVGASSTHTRTAIQSWTGLTSQLHGAKLFSAKTPANSCNYYRSTLAISQWQSIENNSPAADQKSTRWNASVAE